MTPSQRAETLAGMATKATAITRVTLGNGECFSAARGYIFSHVDGHGVAMLRITHRLSRQVIEAPLSTVTIYSEEGDRCLT